ncbi:MAG: type 1 glutamine amidotransferase [Gemmatimonadetes bacterium]|nr:type 1 glutamine amidotransferase [Gemmatimonadota bacterium]
MHHVSEAIRYLLLQVRNPEDEMRDNEIDCFSRTLDCSRESIRVFDLLSGVPSQEELDAADVVLLGGSGDYSVAEGGPWLEAALEAMRGLYESSKPTFASCWGFQAMARAMGGEVVTDRSLAEVGTIWLTSTPEGREDPIFGPLGERFQVHIGHQDIVTRLPEGATLLASSDRVENEAFRFDGKPIYATQFHPELGREDLILRIGTYPPYLPLAGCSTLVEFAAATPDIPETEAILGRFVREVALASG